MKYSSVAANLRCFLGCIDIASVKNKLLSLAHGNNMTFWHLLWPGSCLWRPRYVPQHLQLGCRSCSSFSSDHHFQKCGPLHYILSTFFWPGRSSLLWLWNRRLGAIHHLPFDWGMTRRTGTLSLISGPAITLWAMKSRLLIAEHWRGQATALPHHITSCISCL